MKDHYEESPELAELRRLMAAFGAATARLSARLDRMEEREQKQAATIREVTPRRKFRPLDLSSRIGG